jgi:hypothetical protein
MGYDMASDMTGLRRFDADVEACAKEWRAATAMALDWAIAGNPGGLEGSAIGYLVRCDRYTGFAKPSHDTGIPVAAHEKIAADLAFDLGLPVPPVILWDRGDRKDRLLRFCAVSLVAFQPANKWRAINSVSVTRDRLLPQFTAAASAMIPFDTWIDNTDRINDGNLIAAEPIGKPTVYAYIDHGHTMSHSWGEGPAPGVGSAVGPYPTQVKPDGKIVSAILAAIEALSEDQIRAIADRVPEEYITPKRRECISNGLCQRRAGLRTALAPLVGATP